MLWASLANNLSSKYRAETHYQVVIRCQLSARCHICKSWLPLSFILPPFLYTKLHQNLYATPTNRFFFILRDENRCQVCVCCQFSARCQASTRVMLPACALTTQLKHLPRAAELQNSRYPLGFLQATKPRPRIQWSFMPRPDLCKLPWLHVVNFWLLKWEKRNVAASIFTCLPWQLSVHRERVAVVTFSWEKWWLIVVKEGGRCW